MSARPTRNLWVLDVPWTDRTEAQWGGAQWDAELKLWLWEGTTLPHRLRPFRCPPFSWERWIEDNLNKVATGAKGGVFQPRPHQSEAADAVQASWGAGQPGFLLADDVGLGKTISALEAIRRLGRGKKVLILCPLSVVPHWRRSIEMFGTHGNRFCVINYDRAKKLVKVPESATPAKKPAKKPKTRTANKQIAKKGVSLVDWDIVVCDESHQLRNPVSQRSTIVRNLIAGRQEPAAFVIWASATAGQNPLELSYLSSLLASVTGERTVDLDEFEQWCVNQGIRVKRGSYGKWEWLPNKRDLHRVHELLFLGTPPAGIRRRPTDIAGWPEQQRELYPIELSFTERAQYLKAWTEFRAEMKLRQRGSDPENALVAQLRFRQKASLLRVPHVANMVEDFVLSGVQVAVSCEFLETVNQIQLALAEKGIAGMVISGQTPAAERERQRVGFQQGVAPVCLFTVCEGISLHAGETAVGGNNVPRVTVVADPRWSAIAMLQIEGRCHRDGQAATMHLCAAVPSIEERVVQTVLRRMANTKTMVGDDPDTLKEIEMLVEGQIDFGGGPAGP